MLATQYARWYDIPPQAEGESDSAFTSRVSGALRDAGHIIEAHEVHTNKRYDEEGSSAMDGILGAVAMALRGVDYGRKGSALVGDEIAAGIVKQSPEPKRMSPEEVMLAMLLFGSKD